MTALVLPEPKETAQLSERVMIQGGGSRARLRGKMLRIRQEKSDDHRGYAVRGMQRYEPGNNRIDADRLKEIAEILGVPVSFFLRPPGRSIEKSDDS